MRSAWTAIPSAIHSGSFGPGLAAESGTTMWFMMT
jgi:hypothetical protein